MVDQSDCLGARRMVGCDKQAGFRVESREFRRRERRGDVFEEMELGFPLEGLESVYRRDFGEGGDGGGVGVGFEVWMVVQQPDVCEGRFWVWLWLRVRVWLRV